MSIRNILLLITPSSPGRFAGIAKVARASGWHLTSADRLTHNLDGWTGDGALVTLRDDDGQIKYVRSLIRKGIPVVDLTAARSDIQLPRVASDNAEIGRVAAKHLIDRCFTRAAWFSTGWGFQHEKRFEGFSSLFKTPVERWAWALNPKKTKSDDWKAIARWLEKQLKRATLPIGVMCFDDEDASRMEAVVIGMGLSVPGDVAIIGAGNDTLLCETQTVSLSSVRNNLERNGYAGAALLKRLMDGARKPSKPILIKPQDVETRASTDTLAVTSPLVKRAKAIYESNMRNPPSTVQLAEMLGVSRPTLDRAIAADLGFSPARLLTRLRIDQAKRLLAEGKLSVSEIAYQLGFCTPAHFSNLFRKFTGMPPGKYSASFQVERLKS